MEKYYFFFICLFFINLPYLTKSDESEISKEELYYDYLVAFTRGFGITKEKKCSILLEENKEVILPVFAKIIKKYTDDGEEEKKSENEEDKKEDEDESILSIILHNYKLFFLLEEDCHLSQLATVYTGFQCEEVLKEKLELIGKEMKNSGILDDWIVK